MRQDEVSVPPQVPKYHRDTWDDGGMIKTIKDDKVDKGDKSVS